VGRRRQARSDRARSRQAAGTVRPLYGAGLLLLAAAGIAAVIVWDPVLALISALPLPDLPGRPDLPAWARWLKNAVVIVLVVLGLVGAAERHGRGRRS
jgi:hypothetical protein